jgi:hypothetical protein
MQSKINTVQTPTQPFKRAGFPGIPNKNGASENLRVRDCELGSSSKKN